jgi:serine/threonine protein kinase
MEASARSFTATAQPKPNLYSNDTIQITNALSDVHVKYHVNSKELGHGHYGIVRKCMDRETSQWYAIKSIRKAKVKKIEVLKREIEILKEVKHPNIIELVDVFEDAKYLHLVTELCTGGELFNRIIAKSSSPEGHYSEHDAASIIKAILDAIAYCHSKEIVHRDLKPEVGNTRTVRLLFFFKSLSQNLLFSDDDDDNNNELHSKEFFVFDRIRRVAH